MYLLLMDCYNILEIQGVMRTGSLWGFELRLYGKAFTGHGYKTRGAARAARKTAIRRIIGWCCPVDEFRASSRKQPAELIKWSRYWAEYRRHADGNFLDLIDAKEGFYGVPAARWNEWGYA
jgi:hypothetical protein